jgi:hypothetical protein
MPEAGSSALGLIDEGAGSTLLIYFPGIQVLRTLLLMFSLGQPVAVGLAAVLKN